MAAVPAAGLLEWSVMTLLSDSSSVACMKAAPASLAFFFSSPVMNT